MKKIQKKLKENNSELIESFIELQDQSENYEIWVPYFHQGIVGFIDLVIKNENETSLFKFIKKTKNIEEAIKSLKLEQSVYPKSQSTHSKTIHSYLVIEDREKNRKDILTREKLVKNQPFELLFLDRERKRIESIFELRDNLPRLFQTKNIRLEESALDTLTINPNHSEIERGLLNLEDPPQVITKRFVRKMQRYLKLNKKPPKNVEKLKQSKRNQKETYPTNTSKDDLKNTHRS